MEYHHEIKNKQSGLAISPTPVQDRHMLNFDESQIQVFHELRGKLKEISLAIKAWEIVQRIGARKGGEFEDWLQPIQETLSLHGFFLLWQCLRKKPKKEYLHVFVVCHYHACSLSHFCLISLTCPLICLSLQCVAVHSAVAHFESFPKSPTLAGFSLN